MTTDVKRLYRSRSDRMFSGLAAGLGEYLGLDPTVVRVVIAMSALFLFPTPIIIYLIMMFIVPEESANVSNVEVIKQ